MKYETFVEELKAKKRDVKDLIRHIATRADENPNYTLLLGAGCSITSGIRSANELSNLWRAELYASLCKEMAKDGDAIETQKAFLSGKEGGWYDASREYSSLFEKRYDLQRQRRMFVETEVASKTPGIGYAYLTSLVAENYFNTIFTTNFDDLLNEAFYTYSEQRPIVCAHDSSINSVTVTSKRPKIIKLHGDYLFDDLKSTTKETESLEQNIRAKFVEFGKEYGLIVLGYSGNDRSIMDVLSSMLKNEEYLKGGIYWGVRKNSDISEELRKLMWRDRVYFFEIDGFDEALAEIHYELNKGEVLPAALTRSVKRPADMAARILAMKQCFPLTSSILTQAKNKLEKHSKRAALADLLVNPDGASKTKPLSNGNISDDDLYKLMEVQNLIAIEDYSAAISCSKSHLNGALSNNVRIRLYKSQISAHRFLNQNDNALALAEEIIKIEPYKQEHLIFKASLQSKRDEKIEILRKAIDLNPYASSVYMEIASIYIFKAGKLYGLEKQKCIAEAEKYIVKGLAHDPSWRNECWQLKYDLVELREFNPKNRISWQKEIIDELTLQNPYSLKVLNMQIDSLSADDGDVVFNALLTKIDKALQLSGDDAASKFMTMKIAVVAKKKDKTELGELLKNAKLTPNFLENSELALKLAAIHRESFGEDQEAVDLLKQSLAFDFDADILRALISVLCDQKAFEAAQTQFDLHQHRVTEGFRSLLLIDIYEGKDEASKALVELSKYELINGVKNDARRLYLLVKSSSWTEAERFARTILEPINFSVEAYAEIVNFELARKMNDRKVDQARLLEVLAITTSNGTKAAVAALQDKLPDLLRNLSAGIEADKTFRYSAQQWPVFRNYQKNPDFIKALKI